MGQSSLLTMVMREEVPIDAAGFRKVFLRWGSRRPLRRGRRRRDQAISAWGNTPTLSRSRLFLVWALPIRRIRIT